MEIIGQGEAAFADDLMEGADEIATFMYGRRKGARRKVYHLYEQKKLPLFKMGNTICGRKSRLIQHIKEQEDASLEGGE